MPGEEENRRCPPSPPPPQVSSCGIPSQNFSLVFLAFLGFNCLELVSVPLAFQLIPLKLPPSSPFLGGAGGGKHLFELAATTVGSQHWLVSW